MRSGHLHPLHKRVFAVGHTNLPPRARILASVKACGAGAFSVNVPIHVGHRRVVPDFRWPEQRLVVEADGARFHDGEIAREDDSERQALLEAAGERVLRVRWEQAVCREPQTLRRFRAAGAPSG